MPTMPADQIQWMSTKQASQRLGVTLRTLYRLIDEGQLPAYKVGRVIRLQAAELDAFIDGARVSPGDLRHLYPAESSSDTSDTDGKAT
jgi:excisionase family DNA binding protein